MSGVLDDRRFRIALGLGFLVALSVLAVKWAFTGSLAYDVSVLQGTAPPVQVAGSDGATMAIAPPKSTAVMDLLVDGLMGICFWVGTVVVSAGRFAFGFVTQAGSRAVENLKAPEPAPEELVASAPVHNPLERSEQDLYDLARAAANNDLPKLEDLRIKFRWPRAQDELTAALLDVAHFSATLKQLSDNDPSLAMVREKLTEAWVRFDGIVSELKQLAEPPVTETKATRGGKR